MIYLATPYAHPNQGIREVRARRAAEHAWELMKTGHVVFSPIVHGHTIVKANDTDTDPVAQDWAFWRKQCLEILERCDTLLIDTLIPGWQESRGIEEEINHIKATQIKICFLLRDDTGELKIV